MSDCCGNEEPWAGKSDDPARSSAAWRWHAEAPPPFSREWIFGIRESSLRLVRFLDALIDSADLAAADATSTLNNQGEGLERNPAELPPVRTVNVEMPFAGLRPRLDSANNVVLSEAEEREFEANAFSSRLRIEIHGILKKRRKNLVYVGGLKIWLPEALFKTFLFLVVCLFETDDGYVSRRSLQSENSAIGEGSYEGTCFPAGIDQALSRLRSQFGPALQGLDPTDFIECSGRGQIRLSTHPRYVSWNRERLVEHPNQVIARLAQRLPDNHAGV